jgi:cytochrome c biogenesis protein CcmG/thiol:disulfide interchange protein DsbE
MMAENSAAETADKAPETTQPAPQSPMRFIFLLPVIIFGALALVFLVRLYGGDPSVVPSVLINKPAPEFALAPLEGLRTESGPIPGLTRADLVAGEGDARVSIVNVWASWCVPCRDEHPVLMELAKDDGLRVFGINYKDRPENARRFLGALGNPYEAVGVDENGRSAIDWGVYGVPETFIVDRNGVIRHKHIGPILPHQMEGFVAQVREAELPLQ